ncbi:MAG: sulfurtransferase [Bacteroidetes bacterium B1(2017)]|nr:MAG: sulfurtransferase [Bacteroidetes bacterium B1(2017)]
MQNLGKLMETGEVTVIDVRTPGEFMGGHVAGSKNIPLNEIPDYVEDFKKHKNIIFCCASGGRSMQATMFMQERGVTCQNGGPWVVVNSKL